jgi:hypothetical protein
MEAEKAREEGNDVTAEPFLKPVKSTDPAAAEAKPSKRPVMDEEASPVTGRRFTRA